MLSILTMLVVSKKRYNTCLAENLSKGLGGVNNFYGKGETSTRVVEESAGRYIQKNICSI